MLALGSLSRPFMFQNIESDVAVDHVDQTALVERDVVALRRGRAGRGVWDEMADLARAQRTGDVDDPQSTAEPDSIDDGARHALAELVRAEAGAGRAAEGRIELAHLELPERLDGAEIADVEGQQARMRATAPRLLLLRPQRLLLLVDRNRDAAAADAARHRHHGMRRLRKQRMVIVRADSFRPRQIGDIDDPKARMPAARPHLVAEAQRMVKAVPPAGPGRRLATLDMLPRHPPACDFLRLPRLAQIVEDEDIAEVSFHLGRDVGGALVHVEAMHADAAGLLIADQLRPRGLGHVVDLEAAVVIAALLERFEHR